MDTKIIAVLAVAVVAVAAVAAVIAINADDGFVGVIYDGNGGETLEGEKTSRLTSDVAQTNMFEYKDHAFVAWNTRADGTGDIIHPGDKVNYGKGNIRLYAQWGDALIIGIGGSVSTSYDFKFELSDSEGHTEELYMGHSPVAIPKDGKVNIRIINDDSIVWTLDEATGKFTGTLDDDKILKTYTVNITSEEAVNKQFSLVDGSPYFKFEYNGAATMKIYAFTQEHKVTYNGNGGIYQGETSYTSSAATIQDCLFEYEGYTFVGWNTQKDGSGTAYKVGDEFPTAEKSLKLYAQWEISES